MSKKNKTAPAANASADTNLSASDRGGSSLFVSGAAVISPEIDSFFLRGVADLAGNLLKPNRINNETQFTILMPGVTIDFGDAPAISRANRRRRAHRRHEIAVFPAAGKPFVRRPRR